MTEQFDWVEYCGSVSFDVTKMTNQEIFKLLRLKILAKQARRRMEHNLDIHEYEMIKDIETGLFKWYEVSHD